MAIAFVQQNSNHLSAGATVTAPYTGAQTVGNCNVVAVGFGDITHTISSVADTSGNAYAVSAPLTRAAANSQAVYIATNIKAAAAGANTVTVTFNASATFPDVRILEYSSVSTAAPATALDAQVSVAGANSPISGVSITTTVANDMLVVSTTVSGNSTAYAAPWTNRIKVTTTASLEADQLAATVGSYPATTTLSPTNSTWVSQAIALKAFVADTTAPTTPTSFAAGTPTSSTIPLTWTTSIDPDDANNVLTYTLQRKTGTGSFATVASGIPGVVSGTVSYTDTGLASSTTYTYQVQALDPAGNQSGFSTSTSATTAAGSVTPLFVQDAFSGTISGNNVTQAFTSLQTAGNCNVVIMGWPSATIVINSVTDNRGNTYNLVVGPTTIASPVNTQAIYVAANIQGGSPATTVTVAFNASPISPDVRILEYSGILASNPVDATGFNTGTNSPSTVTLTTLNANDLVVAAATVSTTATAAGGSGATFNARIVNQAPFRNGVSDAVVASAQAVTATFTLSGTGPGWVTQILALKSAGAADTTPPTAPGTPSLTVASSIEIDLSWVTSSDPPNASSTVLYLIERQTGAGSFTQIAQTSPGVLSYNDTGLTASTAYAYRLRGQDAAGNVSVYSGQASATTSAADTTAPSGPTSVTATALSGTSIGLTWPAATDVDNPSSQLVYFIQRYAGTGAPAFATLPNMPTAAGALSFTDTNLQPTTQYNYRLYAQDPSGNNNSANPSPTASAITLAQSPAPVFVQSADSFPVYPLSRIVGQRYLQDVNGKPFLMVGESAQALVVKASLADIQNVYFPDRVARGFNTIWMNLISNNYTGGVANGTIQDGSATYNGVVPFNTSLGTDASGRTMYNLTTQNNTYFQKVDAVMQLAQQFGILVFLNPIDTGGWLTTMNQAPNNTASAMSTYGQWVANRYKTFPNVVWYFGNDFQQGGLPSAANDTLEIAVHDGIFSVDTTHLSTIELFFNLSTSWADPNWQSRIDLNGVYTYYPSYDEVLVAYNQTTLPIFLQETYYDGETFGPTPATVPTQRDLRKQAYWTILSGGIGYHYGGTITYRYNAGWQNNLGVESAQEMTIWSNLFQSIKWWTLVPDPSTPNGTGTFVTAGRGTYAAGTGTRTTIDTNDYVMAAMTSDNRVGIAYLTNTGITITVAMTRFPTGTNNVTVRWYDPTNGTFIAASSTTPAGSSPFSGGTGSGTRTFTTPATANSRNDPDWLLVFTS